LTIKFTLDTNFKLTTSAPRRILPSRRVLQLVLPINIQLSKNFPEKFRSQDSGGRIFGILATDCWLLHSSFWVGGPG